MNFRRKKLLIFKYVLHYLVLGTPKLFRRHHTTTQEILPQKSK